MYSVADKAYHLVISYQTVPWVKMYDSYFDAFVLKTRTILVFRKYIHSFASEYISICSVLRKELKLSPIWLGFLDLPRDSTNVNA